MIFMVSAWMLHGRSNENTGEIDLTNSQLSCKKNDKHENYKGYFHLKSNVYYLSSNFYLCKDFKKLVSGKKLYGRYLKGNHLIIDFYINDKAYYESSFYKVVFSVLLISLLLWAFMRIPIKWFLRKYA